MDEDYFNILKHRANNRRVMDEWDEAWRLDLAHAIHEIERLRKENVELKTKLEALLAEGSFQK